MDEIVIDLTNTKLKTDRLNDVLINLDRNNKSISELILLFNNFCIQNANSDINQIEQNFQELHNNFIKHVHGIDEIFLKIVFTKCVLLDYIIFKKNFGFDHVISQNNTIFNFPLDLRNINYFCNYFFIVPDILENILFFEIENIKFENINEYFFLVFNELCCFIFQKD